MEIIKGGVTAAKGFTASGMHVGLRRNVEKKDIALVYSDTMCNAAAVFTHNNKQCKCEHFQWKRRVRTCI